MKPIADVSQCSISQLTSLTGRTAVVTGGARGLGKAIALRLAEAGARVVVADVQSELAETVANEITSTYRTDAAEHFVDVADSASVKALADFAIEKFGSLDIWVNNAGVFPSAAIAEMPDTEWDRVFAINSKGVFAGIRESSRQMIASEKGGVIINIVSTAGFKGVAHGLSAYVSSKHAVRGLTRQAALELAPHGIRVLGVAPTFCVTEGNLAAMAQNPGFDGNAESIPAAMLGSKLGRIGVPDDIARAVLFCASDMSIFMTGSTLAVDAGELI